MNKTTERVFRFERIRLQRLGDATDSKYGPYLYRDTTDNRLFASWDKPTNEMKYLYKGEDIGYNTDALLYKR